MPALQIIHKDGHTYIKGTADGSVAVLMECLTLDGKRPKIISDCIYNEHCITGNIGQGITTCLRWRRKNQKPNQDARQIALFR